MTTRFKIFFEYFTTKSENGNSVNGYVNNPNDSGGETIYGITRKNHPSLKIWKSIDKLSTVSLKKAYIVPSDELKEIKEVYYNNYYLKVKAGEIDNVNLALNVYDVAVNSGTSRAVKMLQEIVGTTTDGIIGPKTITATNSYKGDLYPLYKQKRIDFYKSIATGSNATFLKGWLNRTEDTKI